MPPSSSSQLARLLHAPNLERVIPLMAPEALHQILESCGLDACGELVVLATPSQLSAVFDLDLWRHAEPGADDQFDAIRFGEWLEVLTDADATLAAGTVAALDRDLVVVGLSRFVRVFDPAAAEPYTTIDGEPSGSDSGRKRRFFSEIGGYQIGAMVSESWDAIVALLVALDASHPDAFHAIMRDCRRMSNSPPEVDGLDDILTAPQQLMSDVAADRDVRRARQGYGTAAEARAFLQMARLRTRETTQVPRVNPLVQAYFRASDDAMTTTPSQPDLATPGLAAADAVEADLTEARDAIADLLSTVESDGPRGLLGAAPATEDGLVHLRTLLAHLGATDRAALHRCERELAFLANALVAGCSFQARSFTPSEASMAAAAVCNLGLELSSETTPATPGSGASSSPDLVTAFERGWTTLYEKVSLFTIERLATVLSGVRSGDTKTHAGLRELRRELVAQRASGTPWKVRDALDVLAILDVPTWTGVLGLVDECPMLPAIIDAIVERRAGSISATGFTFISTSRQIERAQAFVARLPGLLSE